MTDIKATGMVRFLRFCLGINMVIGCCMLIYPLLILIFGESTILSNTQLFSTIPINSIYMKIFAVIVATLIGISIGGRMTKKDDLKDIIRKFDIDFTSPQEILKKGPFTLKDAELLISWISDNKNSLLASSKDIIKAHYILDVILGNMVLEDLRTLQKHEICACFLDMGIFIDYISTRMSDIYDVCANSKQFTVTFKGIKITSITTRVEEDSEKPPYSKDVIKRVSKKKEPDVFNLISVLFVYMIICSMVRSKELIPSIINFGLFGYIGIIIMNRIVQKIELQSLIEKFQPFYKNKPEEEMVHLNAFIKYDPLYRTVDPNLTQNNVNIFKGALRRYENSLWKTPQFTKKAQIAFSIFLQRFNEQELIIRKSNESVDMHRKALELSECWQSYDEMVKQEERKGQRKILEMMKAHDTRYRSNYVYIVKTNSPDFIEVTNSGKVISVYKWSDPDE
ncbi:hypothetical protein [Listeria marthii]|uniref:hypothetical protein n=1 Tax=Listeria marthii TaxID=529731 RepID=UPI001E569A45|nr:hypothetical protein [Listeria marthii]MCD2255049.1 hypothetical protein [Listeria marthii]